MFRATQKQVKRLNLRERYIIIHSQVLVIEYFFCTDRFQNLHLLFEN